MKKTHFLHKPRIEANVIGLMLVLTLTLALAFTVYGAGAGNDICYAESGGLGGEEVIIRKIVFSNMWK